MTELMLLSKLVIANTGKNVIAFSHKPIPGDDPAVVQNRRLIIAAINAGFTINLSADNTAHADKLAELGIAPVVTVLARAYARRAARRRLKWWPDQWAETIGEWRDRTFSLPRRTPAGRRMRSARRHIRTRLARLAMHAPGFGMPWSAFPLMAHGGKSRPRWPPEMSQLEKAGLSGTIGQWPR
jgi:hypothetical protein